MGANEQKAYFETAVAQLEEATLALEHRRYALASFLSSSSAECATAALILALGSKPSKKHRNSLVLHRLSGEVGEPLRPRLVELVTRMKQLEPHITKARYPIRKGSVLLPPVRYYGANEARGLLDQASAVLSLVKAEIAKSR